MEPKFLKKVVFINKNVVSILDLGKIYTASECYVPSVGYYYDHYTIDADYTRMYPISWFIDLKELRKEKLDKINGTEK